MTKTKTQKVYKKEWYYLVTDGECMRSFFMSAVYKHPLTRVGVYTWTDLTPSPLIPVVLLLEMYIVVTVLLRICINALLRISLQCMGALVVHTIAAMVHSDEGLVLHQPSCGVPPMDLWRVTAVPSISGLSFLKIPPFWSTRCCGILPPIQNWLPHSNAQVDKFYWCCARSSLHLEKGRCECVWVTEGLDHCMLGGRGGGYVIERYAVGYGPM